MPLAPGTRLGPYEVVALIGEGGMGQVYRATDTRLHRTVALKVLPPALTGQSDLRERFDREARAIGALNHPHICTLHDIGRARPEPAGDQQEHVDFLIMEHVEGETLAARLARTAPSGLDMTDVLTYGTQIADALDRAHRQGIVHRDLKPGNIMITKAGIKLLDFGLAKILPAPASGSVSMLATGLVGDLTTQGTIVGTLQYMAPEQVEGRETDARTDIFAFGAVLYEMATGEKAFDGRSQASVIAAILDRDPPAIDARIYPVSSEPRGSEVDPRSSSRIEGGWSPASVKALARVVAGCLAKDPDDRWQTARDLGRGLQWIPTATDAATLSQTTPRRAASTWWLAAAALATGVLIGAAAVSLLFDRADPAARHETRFSIDLPFTLRSTGWSSSQAAISPDGRRIVYQGGGYPDRVLYSRALDETDGTRIEGTDGGQNPFFAPDGESVGFFADGQLKRISLLGGRAVKVCDAQDVPYGAAWHGDTIVFSTSSGLSLVSAGGGQPRQLTTLSADTRRSGHRSPVFLPGGSAVVYVVMRSGESPGAIAAVEISSGTTHTIVPSLQPESRGVQYLSSGHLLYEQNQALIAAPFDPRTLKTTGSPVQVARGIATMGTTLAQFAVSDSGTLVYIPAARIPDEVLTWVGRDGSEQPLPAPRGRYHSVRVSPDGSWVSAVGEGSAAAPIWILNLASSRFGELPHQKGAFGPGPIPLWTPDSASLTYLGGTQREVMIQPVDRSAGERILFTPPDNVTVGDGSWTRSGAGDVLAFTKGDMTGDVWIWSSAENKAKPFVATRFFEGNPQFSPDGRWLAYTSGQSGAREVWVQPFPDGGRPVQVSVGGGRTPTWGPLGREIFYINEGALMSAAVTMNGWSFVTAAPRKLVDVSEFLFEFRGRNYDIDPKTGRFLMIKSVGGPSPPAQLVVVTDWQAGALAKVTGR